ncbi:MAG: DUF4263 domain-containing protein [Clostridia bacterium]|nr:DUF4263 domain-containing protein [Clostridia bacterium]
MNLYERDYNIILTEEEREAWDKEKKFISRKGVKSNRDSQKFSHPDASVRRFIWCKSSLYPNNFLLPSKYESIQLQLEADAFHEVIYKAKNELEIQRYIKDNRKWFIPGSIFLDYNFGHHAAYLFPEQALGNEYAVDYMLLGKSSDGYSIVLIEFEKSNTEYLISTANIESQSVKKGMAQINDWERWINKNRDYFLRNIGLTGYGIDVPLYRIYYYLVVSRRDYMNEDALDVRSQTMYHHSNLKIVTFDRLVDNVAKLEKYHSW